MKTIRKVFNNVDLLPGELTDGSATLGQSLLTSLGKKFIADTKGDEVDGHITQMYDPATRILTVDVVYYEPSDLSKIQKDNPGIKARITSANKAAIETVLTAHDPKKVVG